MSREPTGVAETPAELRRVLGSIVGESPGPTLIVMTGIHGNEPSGVMAARRVLKRLEADGPPLGGELCCLAGNLGALAAAVRFIDLDLNRLWLPDKVSALRSAGELPERPREDRELRELLSSLIEVVDRARGPIYFLDLHTCSAEGPPFLTVGDTVRNRRFAESFPLPLILGLEEQVDGALLEFLNNHGFVTMGVEAGLHTDPRSVDRHEAVLWIALVSAGLMAPEASPELERHRQLLVRATRGAPRIVEVRRRHPVAEDDRFRMEPGFRNFQPLAKGTLLARDKNGPIRMPEDGLLLLPLYQGQGNDGFFVSGTVRGFWLKISTALRRLRLYPILRVLPGVRLEDRQKGVFVVDTRIARIYPLEIFHLFGFRKLRRSGSELVVSRRCYDLSPPSAPSLRQQHP